MDNFINLAKQGYEAYEKSHSRGDDNPDVRKTGGEEYNSPHHSQQGSSNHEGPNIDHDEVVRTAKAHSSGDDDDSLFSSALSFAKQNKGQHQDPLDEDAVQDAHRKAYDDRSGQNMSASSLGSAAALEALKKYTSGKSGSGSSHSQLISMAMAEASKLFDKSGGASSGGKQDAVNGAAMTVVKLLVQSKFSGGVTGGGNSGGLGSLMSLASKLV